MVCLRCEAEKAKGEAAPALPLVLCSSGTSPCRGESCGHAPVARRAGIANGDKEDGPQGRGYNTPSQFADSCAGHLAPTQEILRRSQTAATVAGS